MDLKTLFKTTACAVAISCSAVGAQAATISFDLQGNDGGRFSSLPSEFSLTQGGLTATFDARSFSSATQANGIVTSGTVQDGHIGRYYGGAGVVNSSSDGSHTVDGRGWDDFVEITFSAMVEIKEISFGYYDGYDNFRILTDASGDGEIGVGDAYGSNVNVSQNSPYTGFNGLLTNVFAVAAFGDYDSWKLKSITVEYDDTPPPAVIPLPAAGWLLLGAFGGMAALRRKR
ncbi:VPLPA-CTERM sorting domain-containing protein [Roseovarius sp. EL26]|uniref:VPLPA-CTERM sorting domain-containing protein n=1 Tax=Roseovarius sp. EL26 TaxID=2126672 RepID=UPI000EA36F4B|nr:VPLPA-CTERM sorting domain-containing protein [Roseovarius sp. EL26]